MADMFDVVVVGAGPAGLAAAAAVGEAGLSCLSVDAMGPGGQLMNLGRLHDCPDLPEGTTGPDLLGLLSERVIGAGVEMGFGEVRRIVPAGGGWRVETDEERWAARAVIVATGRGKGTTGVADEVRFEGRGLSHCANCDGPLYKDQPVVVHGSDRWALTEAIELAAVAGEVTLVAEPGSLARLGEAERRAFADAQPNIEVVEGHIAGLVGDDALAAVDVEAPAGAETVTARAIFLLAGRQPASAIAAGVLSRGGDGTIAIDRRTMAASAGGAFAAGDVASGSTESIPAAIADGAAAGQNAVRWVRAARASG